MDEVASGESGGKPGRIGRRSLQWLAAIGLVWAALGVSCSTASTSGSAAPVSPSESTSQNYVGNGSIDFDLYIGANPGTPIHDLILSACNQGSNPKSTYPFTYTIGNPQSRTAAIEISLSNYTKPATFPATFPVGSQLSASLRVNGDAFSSGVATAGNLMLNSTTTGSFAFVFTVAINSNGYRLTKVQVQGTFKFSRCP